MMKGVENALSKHPEIKTVANVAGEWDATKARAVISTVIKQNPDLCGVVGKGVFDKEIAYQVMDQGRDLNDMISTVLETGLPAGKLKAVIYSPQLVISKDTLRRGLCWSASALKK
jgi:ribose transport system substrate-binding protein